MGCELNPKIVYTEFSAVVRRQKEILKKLIERKQAQIRKVHPGLTCFKDGVREIPIESIPGIIEAGWVPPADRGSERKTRTDTSDPDVLYNALKTILNATKSNQYAWPFQTPVDRKMVRMIYYLLVKTMDNGHPERAFFQKFETFGLGQTNWAEIWGDILAISSQTIGTILTL